MTYQPSARLRSSVGKIYILSEPLTRLGREPENNIILASEKASRYHAEIRFVDGRYFIEDLNSKNGIRLNGKLLKNEEVVLTKGDTLHIGGLEFFFEHLETNETVTEIRPIAAFHEVNKEASKLF